MSRQPEISASILAADFGRLRDEVLRAEYGGVDSIHLDVMDGHFVDNLTFGPLGVDAVRPHTALPLHSHLMIQRPLAYAERFAQAGSDLIVFHVEADDDPGVVIDAIAAAGKRPGIALNPETPASAVLPYLDRVDLVLVMTVNPGRGGQSFMHEVVPKIGDLRAALGERGARALVGVDGGVGPETIATAFQAGGDVFVVGTALYSTQGDLAPVVSSLRAAAGGGE